MGSSWLSCYSTTGFFRIFRLAIASIDFNILGFGAIFVGLGEYDSDMLTIFGAVLVGTSFYFQGKVEEE